MSDYQVTQLGVIEASGADHINFLQGQLTADLVRQTTASWVYAGHCDAKGKLWAIMRVIKLDNKVLLLLPRASLEQSLAQLQKFSVFSQIEFTDQSDAYTILLNRSASTARYTVTDHAENRALQLGLGDACLWLEPATNNDYADGDEAWLAYEIEHGVACLTPATSGQFVPQMVGLDRLGGIDFKKGCYIGQETVARMHYLGQNKRLPRQLRGQANNLPAAGAALEQQQGENWRRTGAVLNSVRYDNGDVVLLAVLPADIENTASLRIKGEESSRLTLCPPFDNQEIADE